MSSDTKFYVQIKLADQILAEDKHLPLFEVGLHGAPPIQKLCLALPPF